MKPTNIFLTVIGVTLIFLFCALPGGPRSASAAEKAATNPDHPLKVKHTHDHDHNVTWEIKKNGNGAFRLEVTPDKTVEWQNMDNKETNMSIIVKYTNDWKLAQGSWGAPIYGLGCATCGQIDTTSGRIQLTFVGASNSTNYHYQIVVPDPDKTAKVVSTNYDYDMVDATIVWSQAVGDNKHKGGESKSPGQ